MNRTPIEFTNKFAKLKDYVITNLTSNKRYWSAGMVFLGGLMLSLVAFWVLRQVEYRDIESSFKTESADRCTAIKGAFTTQTAMLELVQSAFAGNLALQEDAYRQLMDPFRHRLDGIESIEWIPCVPHEQRAEFEKTAQRDGLKNFQITEQKSRGSTGSLRTAGSRSIYYPIRFMGPESKDPMVFGYDLGSDPTRYEAICQARDSGKITASSRITFIEDPNERSGFLILLPVFETGKSVATIDDRRQNLRGLVAGVFRADAMIREAITPLQPEGIDVCFFDPSSFGDKRVFYFHSSRTNAGLRDIERVEQIDPKNTLHFHDELEVAGRPWSILCLASPSFISARQTRWPWVSLMGGLAFTSIAAACVVSAIDRRLFAERLVQEKRLHVRQLEEKVHERTENLRLAQEEIIFRLVSASLWHDEETGSHIRRTGLFSEALAKAAGWTTTEAEVLRQAAPMHDVGKIGIPDAILRKPGSLTPEEFEVMKTHTLIGAEILTDSDVPILQMAQEIALNHHERWDGQGYPAGKAGTDIPESARILAIVDVYDALSQDRVYRQALPPDEIAELMYEQSGKQFDPSLLALFFTILPEIAFLARDCEPLPDNQSLVRSFAGVLAKTSPLETSSIK